MRKFKISFLFFCLCITNPYCLNNNKLYSQQTIDSLAYYYELTYHPKKSTDLALAYNFYKNKKEESLLIKDTLSAIHYLRSIAIIQNRLGFLHESEGSSVEALKLLENLKVNDATSEARIGIYNQLGLVNRSLLEYDKALEYYNKVLKIAQTTQQKNIVQNNKAFIYKEQHKFELAVIELKKVYESSLEFNDTNQTSRALGNLGLAQSKLNLTEALPNIKKALDIRLKENDFSGIYSSYKHLVEYYKDRNNTQKALYYADLSYTLAQSFNSISYKLDALSIIMDLNKNAKVTEYKRLTDSFKTQKRYTPGN